MALFAHGDPMLGDIAEPAATVAGHGAPEPRFHETPRATLRRILLGLLYPLRRKRLPGLPATLWMTAEFLISPSLAARHFDVPKFHGPLGLVGISNDLRPETVIDRYRRGFYPFCHVGPIKWWSPDVRAVLVPAETHIEKNVRRHIRKGKYRVTFDADFAAVMRACAEPRPGKTPLTWITPTIMRAFWALHRQGHAHSVEVWDADGRLVGGLYGLAIGNVFFGESQFARARDASKVAVATLHCHLAHWGFALRDAKAQSAHLSGLGFHTIPRAAFLEALDEETCKPGRVGRWTVDQSLDVAAWQTKT